MEQPVPAGFFRCSRFELAAVPIAVEPTETRSMHPDLAKKKRAGLSDRVVIAGDPCDLTRGGVELDLDDDSSAEVLSAACKVEVQGAHDGSIHVPSSVVPDSRHDTSSTHLRPPDPEGDPMKPGRDGGLDGVDVDVVKC